MPALNIPENAEIYDISPAISESTAVFPGDREFRREVALDFKAGDHLVLSSIDTTLHIGAHADAPAHFSPKGATIDERPLNFYIGSCQVISVRVARGARIRPDDLDGTPLLAPRVLFKTGSFPDPDAWNGDFVSLSPELVDHLARNGVKLVGVDTPSVDPAEDRALESHQAILRNDLANLEGLVLSEVPDGLYTLIALPLKIRGADASPVRAILVRGQGK